MLVHDTVSLEPIVLINIYYCTTGRAILGNIQLEGGSIGRTEGRDNTEPESGIFPHIARPKVVP